MLNTAGTAGFDGDSLSAGAGGVTPYPSLITLTGGRWNIFNKAVNGQFLSTALANAPTVIDPLFTGAVGKKVVVIWAGIDDLASSVTPATVYSNLQSYCAARHAAGELCVVFSLPSNKFVDNTRATVNASLRANHAFADGFIDMIGTQADCTGCWSDTTVFQADGIHLNQNGINTIEVPLANSVINGLP